MKIIATMGTNKYLAEVDSRELRELNSDVKLEIGAEYENYQMILQMTKSHYD